MKDFKVNTKHFKAILKDNNLTITMHYSEYGEEKVIINNNVKNERDIARYFIKALVYVRDIADKEAYREGFYDAYG